MANQDTGKVNIHGKEYTTVAARVQMFREKHGEEYGIQTEVLEMNDDVVVMKASIYKLGNGLVGHLIATGHAEERRASSQINRTSALENAETSAIGRALAAFGLAGTEFASADEVAGAIKQQRAPAPKPALKQDEAPKAELASDVQKRQIKSFLTAMQVPDAEMADFIKKEFGIDPAAMTKAEAVKVMGELR